VAIRIALLFVILLAHMGLYLSQEQMEDPESLLDDLVRPVWSETLSVLFADMRGFTQLCQSVGDPLIIRQRLNQFLTMLADEVLHHDGIVNKFLGDGVLALFRGADCAPRAVMTAFGMTEQFDRMRREWDERSNQKLDFLDVGIGIVTDQVLLGTIGSGARRDFTAFGNAVNLASAFKQAARGGRRILVDQLTCRAVRDSVEEIEGPDEFMMRREGRESAITYKQYHLKSLRKSLQVRIFISHNHGDREFVETRLVAPLRAAGIETWYCADDIPKGAAWTAAIRKGLAMCNWVIVVVSSRSARSRWVKREIDLSVIEERFDDRVIPVLLDDTDLRDVNEYLLTMQAVDARQEEDLPGVIRQLVLGYMAKSAPNAAPEAAH
jgi:class 3 adenylate cyclase